MPARPQDPQRLAECLPPVRGLGQVIERAEQQHRVLGFGWHREVPRVAKLGGERSHRFATRRLPCLLHMQRHRVDQMHAIPAPGQRRGVGAGAAAHVQYPYGRCGQQPVQQFQ